MTVSAQADKHARAAMDMERDPDREFWQGVFRLVLSLAALIAKRWGFDYPPKQR